MEGKELFKEQRNTTFTEKEILELGKLYKVGIGTEFFKKTSEYGSRKVSQLCRELIFGDQETLSDVYFLKGQIVGSLDMTGHPGRVVIRRLGIIKDREEKAKKTKEREERDARRGR